MTVRGYFSPGALNDGDDRELVLISLERQAVEAISEVINAHDEDFVGALAPLGIDWHTVMLPEWKRALMPADLDRFQLIDDEPKRLRNVIVCWACGAPAGEQKGTDVVWRCGDCGSSTVRVLQVDDPDPAPSSTAVDGVYMTDIVRDDGEGFGERIEAE